MTVAAADRPFLVQPIGTVPTELLALMTDVVFLVEDEPPPDDPELLGCMTARH